MIDIFSNKKWRIVFFIPLIAVVGKYIRFGYMESLVDNGSATAILERMQNHNFFENRAELDGAFWKTAQIFSYFDFGLFTNIIEWEIFISVLLNIVCCYFIIKLKQEDISLKLIAFFYISIGLMNIFVFMLSKEIIQFLFFFILYIIIENKTCAKNKKIILLSISLILWGLWFRTYFLLTGLFYIVLFFLEKKIYINKKINFTSLWSELKSITLFYLFFALLIIGVGFFYSELQNRLIFTHVLTLHNLFKYGYYPTTAIEEWIPTVDIISFLINHLIITIRLLLPLELLWDGMKYIPFILYQLVITKQIFIIKKNNNSCAFKTKTAATLYMSFLFTSAIFEPDFGSWIRHEMALFPIIYIIFHKIKIYN